MTTKRLITLCSRIDRTVEQSEHRLTVRFFGMTLGIVGVMNAILFALLRVVH
jgi:hypothetical protein